MLLVCGHIDEADDLADDIELFLGRRPEVLPALELSGALGTQSEEQVANRMQLVFRLADERIRGSGFRVQDMQAENPLHRGADPGADAAGAVQGAVGAAWCAKLRRGSRWSRRS